MASSSDGSHQKCLEGRCQTGHLSQKLRDELYTMSAGDPDTYAMLSEMLGQAYTQGYNKGRGDEAEAWFRGKE